MARPYVRKQPILNEMSCARNDPRGEKEVDVPYQRRPYAIKDRRHAQRTRNLERSQYLSKINSADVPDKKRKRNSFRWCEETVSISKTTKKQVYEIDAIERIFQCMKGLAYLLQAILLGSPQLSLVLFLVNFATPE